LTGSGACGTMRQGGFCIAKILQRIDAVAAKEKSIA
jgi:hypothetical protein